MQTMAPSSDLARVLGQTMNPLSAKTGMSNILCARTDCEAEAQLKKEAATRPDFLENLLTLIATPQEPIPIRQAAALFFKNFVRQNWKVFAPLYRNVLILG
jgi:hypothetical protein